MANYSTGMLANLNGQDNYFDEAAPTTGMAAAAEEAAEETATGMFPPQDPSGISVLQKTLLPFDDHPYAQVRRSSARIRTVCADSRRDSLPPRRAHFVLSGAVVRAGVTVSTERCSVAPVAAHKSAAATRSDDARARAPRDSRAPRSGWRLRADLVARS
jgi:hypothetical protein